MADLFDELSRTAQRAYKHVATLVSADINKDNLIALFSYLHELRLVGYLVEGVGKVHAQHGVHDFTWVSLLTADERRSMHLEGLGVVHNLAVQQTPQGGRLSLQHSALHAPAQPRNPAQPALPKGAVGPVHLSSGAVAHAIRQASEVDLAPLKQVKHVWRARAKARERGALDAVSKKAAAIAAKIQSAEDWVYHSPLAGQYLTAYSQAVDSFEVVSVHGAQNDVERKILAAGGLYKVIKSANKAVKSVGKILAGDVTSVASLGTAVFGILNQIAGITRAVSEAQKGQEEDFRSLTAQMGLDKEVEEFIDYVKRSLKDELQEGTIRSQVREGQHSLRRAINLYEKDLEPLRARLRHSRYWVAIWGHDLEALKSDLNELSSVEADITAQGPAASVEERAARGQLLAQVAARRKSGVEEIERIEMKLEVFDGMLERPLRKINDIVAAIETRRAILRSQANSMDAGLQPHHLTTLAEEAARKAQEMRQRHTWIFNPKKLGIAKLDHVESQAGSARSRLDSVEREAAFLRKRQIEELTRAENERPDHGIRMELRDLLADADETAGDRHYDPDGPVWNRAKVRFRDI